LESARAVGFTSAQTYRYVVIPQAMRRVLPATAGQFANLIKDSSLLYVIGLGELTMQAKEAHAATYATFESYIPMALGYLILTLPISFWTRSLEERFRYET
jgi:polar amino acid transport system permease protein